MQAIARRAMKCVSLYGLFMFAVVLVLGVPKTTSADTVYSYDGNLFNSFVQSQFGLQPPPPGAIDISFTVAQPLGANFSGSVTPGSFILTDGGTLGLNLFNTVISSTGCGSSTNSVLPTVLHPCLVSDSFSITTNGQGNIATWSIFASWSAFRLSSSQSLDQSAIFGQSFADEATASIALSPGTWSITTTPEPSTVLLFCVGLSGLAAILRRKLLA